MNKLTQYWRQKRYALNVFLKSYPPADANRGKVQQWFDDITANPSAVASPEGDLEKKLDDLAKARDAATEQTLPGPAAKPNPARKSRRLLEMVQGTVGVVPGNGGFGATIGDMHTGGGAASPVGKYYTAANEASVAAAKFLIAVKRDGMTSPTLSDVHTALAALRTTVPTTPLDPFINECIDGLIASLDGFLKFGGGGDGSGYWPSIIISSSSSGR